MNNTKDIQTDILTYSNNNNPRISRSSPNLRNASTNTNQICLNVQTATEKCNDFTQKMSKSKKTAIENDKTFVMLRKKAKDFEDSSFINKGKPKFKKQNENLNKVKAAEKFPTHCQEIAKEENQFSTVSNKIRHKETFSKYNHETAQPKFYKPDCFTSNTNKTELILLKMTQTKPISSSPQKEVNSSLIPPIRPRGGDSTPRRLRRNRSNMSTPDTNDENESPNEGVCTCNDEYLQEENSNEELNWQHSDPNAMPRYNSPVVPSNVV